MKFEGYRTKLYLVLIMFVCINCLTIENVFSEDMKGPDNTAVSVSERSSKTIEEKVLNNLLLIENKEIRPGTSGEKGTGLGLILSNEFMLLNHGKISISSHLGQGTTVTISLPKLS